VFTEISLSYLLCSITTSSFLLIDKKSTITDVTVTLSKHSKDWKIGRVHLFSYCKHCDHCSCRHDRL